MTDNNLNKAHPKSTFTGEYPYVHATIHQDGSFEYRGIADGKEYYAVGHTSGNYHEQSPTGIHVASVVDKQYQYNSDGKSSTIDGHSDNKTSGNSRINIDGSNHQEIAQDNLSGVGGKSINASQESSVAGSTSGDSFTTTKGNSVHDHAGHEHKRIDGDKVNKVTGNKVDVIDGDYALNVAGAFDVHADTIRYKCKNFIVEADTVTITTLTGDIIIQNDPNNIIGAIIILSPNNYIQTLSKKGSRMEGGGPISIPVTFKR